MERYIQRQTYRESRRTDRQTQKLIIRYINDRCRKMDKQTNDDKEISS